LELLVEVFLRKEKSWKGVTLKEKANAGERKKFWMKN
jgi:hypothetical protein